MPNSFELNNTKGKNIICSLWTRICPHWFISKLSLSKQDEVFNSKKSQLFLLKVKEFEILHCIQPSIIRTADHEWVLQEAKVMKHRTKKYTRYSFRKEFTTVLEKSPETTSNALLGPQWGQKIIKTNVLGISSSDLVMTKFEFWLLNIALAMTNFPFALGIDNATS